MALTIDSTHLAESYLPAVQDCFYDLGGPAGQYQIYRVCAHAKVTHGVSIPTQMLSDASIHLTRAEALEWQPDQDDDLDEAEVILHLNQQAATSPLLEELHSQPNHGITSTTVVTSLAVQSPSLTASALGRPSSSFHRYSVRLCLLEVISGGNMWIWQSSNVRKVIVIPRASIDSSICRFFPKLSSAGARSRINESPVLWHLQFDYVDLLSRRSHSAWRPTKRTRTALNAFHQMSSALPVHNSSQQQHRPEAKRFNGVRYRHDRKTWSAEMKPPKHKNKVYFGESQSQTQAARIVDAAFHYYGKPRFLNFPDTPRVLSSKVIPAGLDEECKLKFVKEQARWLASLASALPPSSASVYSKILVSSSEGCTADTSRLPSLSEIASFLSLDGDGDEADDGISQPQPSLLPYAEAGSGGSDWLEMQNGTGAYAEGAFVGTSEERRGELEWNIEDALVDPGLCVSSWPSSFVRITEGWDSAEHCSTLASANVGNSSPLSGESQKWWMNYPALSPPRAVSPVPCNPGHFQDDVARAVLEQQSLGVEWLS